MRVWRIENFLGGRGSEGDAGSEVPRSSRGEDIWTDLVKEGIIAYSLNREGKL